MEQNKLELYEPHEKQKQIHAFGKDKTFRMLLAGNRVGKTYCGAMEAAMHATGNYPSWWQGLIFDRAVTIWAVAQSFGGLRNALMPLYLGGIDEVDYGKGAIPKSSIVKWTMSKGVSGVVDMLRVKHKNGGESTIFFKSYEQDWKQFMSAKVDFIHLDEEPNENFFSECVMRTATTGGGILITMTPLQGMSDVCLKFLEGSNKNYAYVQASWQDNPHLSDKDRELLEAGSEPHLLEARSKGIPAIGSGKVYPVLEEQILVEPFQLPDYFRHVYALDFGWENTAVVFLAHDPETDIVYLYDCYKQGKLTPEQHIANLTARSIRLLPGVCDPAKGGVSQSDGQQAYKLYESAGLKLNLAENGVETGIMKVLTRMQAGTFKVFKVENTEPWLREFRMYGRDDKGRVKKTNDHLMDATRYGIVSGLTQARTKARKDFSQYTISQYMNASVWSV